MSHLKKGINKLIFTPLFLGANLWVFPRVDFVGVFSLLYGGSIVIIFHTLFHVVEMSTKSHLYTGLFVVFIITLECNIQTVQISLTAF